MFLKIFDYGIYHNYFYVTLTLIFWVSRKWLIYISYLQNKKLIKEFPESLIVTLKGYIRNSFVFYYHWLVHDCVISKVALLGLEPRSSTFRACVYTGLQDRALDYIYLQFLVSRDCKTITEYENYVISFFTYFRKYCINSGSYKQRYWSQAEFRQHSHLLGKLVFSQWIMLIFESFKINAKAKQ